MGGKEWANEPVAEHLLGTEWVPFATAAVVLIDVLVAEETLGTKTINGARRVVPALLLRNQKIDTAIDGCLNALRRSLLRDGGAMVAQQLHLSGLRALGNIARVCPRLANRIIVQGGLSIGVKLLG